MQQKVIDQVPGVKQAMEVKDKVNKVKELMKS